MSFASGAIPCIRPIIITCAITGAETTLAHNPNLPVTPDQQGIASADAVSDGASIIHLHVRDDAGKPTQDIGRFRAAIEAIKSRCAERNLEQPIIQISTGGSVDATLESRREPLIALKGLYEMASLNLGTMNFFDDVFYNPLNYVMDLAGLMQALGVTPELGVYDVGHIWIAQMLMEKGLLSHPMHFTFAMGVLGGIPYEQDNLNFLAGKVGPHDTWGVAGIGRHEFPAAEQAIPMGGNVRVGFEDNVYIERGRIAASNAELVRKAASYARTHGRAIAKPSEAKEIMGIKSL